jgi:hypothetical protein
MPTIQKKGNLKVYSCKEPPRTIFLERDKNIASKNINPEQSSLKEHSQIVPKNNGPENVRKRTRTTTLLKKNKNKSH